MNPYIFGINVTRGHFKHIYMAIPLPVFKRSQNGSSTREMLGATGIKLGMSTQLDCESNIVWVPPGHTSSFWYVRLKCRKWYLQETLGPR